MGGFESTEVISRTLDITVCHDKLARDTPEGSSVVDGLVHETRQLYIEAFGAVSINNCVRVGDVGLEVVRSDVLTVPARRERKLEADTIKAVGVEEILLGEIMAPQGGLGIGVVVEAVEAKSTLGQIDLGSLVVLTPVGFGGVRLANVKAINRVVATSAVARNHAEVVRERLDGLVRVLHIGVQEVVADEC